MADKNYYIYILKSLVSKKSYVGYSMDVDARLAQHNKGESNFTNKYKPWTVIHTEMYETQEEATDRERYLKSRSGRRWLKSNIFKN